MLNNNKKIGKIIKYIRVQGNMTQEELASRIHIGRSTLSDYEREKTDINFDTIVKICKECNYEITFKGKNDTITIDNIDRKL